ncbi:MAG: SDR family oxidoreductase [Hyphomicrobiales bacterium]|nr:SDR family oxidoreductase [Hyphomicrobiales bacterium]
MSTELDPRAAGGRRLAGKACIVTGAGQGIGRATARRFAAEGARVIVAERNEESGVATASQIADAGGEARFVQADVATFEGADALMEACVSAYGAINVIANVVGGAIWWQPFHEFSVEQVQLELERSLFPTLWCCKAVLPRMIEQGSGVIVNFGSSVVNGGMYRTPYAVSKGGIVALTRVLAAENGRHNIRVNCVTPGTTIIEDRTTARLVLRPGEIAEPSPRTKEFVEETRGQRAETLGRHGKAEEQAAVAAFLASEDSSFITGQIIDCDGGRF